MNETHCASDPADVLISYSINAEDVLLRRVFSGRRSGFFVDVGAEDPINGNDLFGLYELGWRGINIEPNPHYFAQLVQKRPGDLNLQVFLSEEPAEKLPFFIVENTGLSTADAGQADVLAGRGSTVHRIDVKARTLKQVLEDAQPPHIDILKIDVEGFEEQVVRGNDWKQFRPSLVLLEATLPQSPVRRQTTITKFLESVGYRFVHHDGLNDFFVEESFTLPPDSFRAVNVFDNVTRWDMVALRSTYDELHSQFKRVEYYAKALEGERDEMSKALTNADDALEEKRRSEQRISAVLDATSQIAIGIITHGAGNVDMTLAQSSLLPIAEGAAKQAEIGHELVVVDKPPSLQEDDRHLLNIQLQMVQARLESLKRQNECLNEMVKDLQFQNRRLSAGNEQLQGERLALNQALDQVRGQTGMLTETRRVVSELQCMIRDEGTARADRAAASNAQVERVRAEAIPIEQVIEKVVQQQIGRNTQERWQRSDRDTIMLQAIYASTSWKLTQPVRALSRLLRSGR